MGEHEWEKLYTLGESRYQQANPVYAGVDRCNTCKAIRIEDKLRDHQPYFYLRAGWSSHREPPCHD